MSHRFGMYQVYVPGTSRYDDGYGTSFSGTLHSRGSYVQLPHGRWDERCVVYLCALCPPPHHPPHSPPLGCVLLTFCLYNICDTRERFLVEIVQYTFVASCISLTCRPEIKHHYFNRTNSVGFLVCSRDGTRVCIFRVSLQLSWTMHWVCNNVKVSEIMLCTRVCKKNATQKKTNSWLYFRSRT